MRVELLFFIHEQAITEIIMKKTATSIFAPELFKFSRVWDLYFQLLSNWFTFYYTNIMTDNWYFRRQKT